MHTFIVVIHVILCLFLILVVLLQAGRSDMASGLTGGGGVQTNWGAPQQTTLLGKITAGAAVCFMITSMTLAWFSNASARAGSVMDDDLINQIEQEDAKPAPAGESAAPPAPAQEAPAAPAEGAAPAAPVEGAAPAAPVDGAAPAAPAEGAAPAAPAGGAAPAEAGNPASP